MNDKDHPVDEEGKSQNMKVSENVSVASEKEESPVTELEDEETVELDSDALSFENHKPPPAKQGRFRGWSEKLIYISIIQTLPCSRFFFQIPRSHIRCPKNP